MYNWVSVYLSVGLSIFRAISNSPHMYVCPTQCRRWCDECCWRWWLVSLLHYLLLVPAACSHLDLSSIGKKMKRQMELLTKLDNYKMMTITTTITITESMTIISWRINKKPTKKEAIWMGNPKSKKKTKTKQKELIKSPSVRLYFSR